MQLAVSLSSVARHCRHAGTPEDIVKVKRSYTGQFRAPVLPRKSAGGREGEEVGGGGGVRGNRRVIRSRCQMRVEIVAMAACLQCGVVDTVCFFMCPNSHIRE
jgi:hypothetical protein